MSFPVNLAKSQRTPFLTEHLRWLLLVLKDLAHAGPKNKNQNKTKQLRT